MRQWLLGRTSSSYCAIEPSTRQRGSKQRPHWQQWQQSLPSPSDPGHQQQSATWKASWTEHPTGHQMEHPKEDRSSSSGPKRQRRGRGQSGCARSWSCVENLDVVVWCGANFQSELYPKTKYYGYIPDLSRGRLPAQEYYKFL